MSLMLVFSDRHMTGCSKRIPGHKARAGCLEAEPYVFLPYTVTATDSPYETRGDDCEEREHGTKP
jgi:hypothetical protein